MSKPFCMNLWLVIPEKVRYNRKKDISKPVISGEFRCVSAEKKAGHAPGGNLRMTGFDCTKKKWGFLRMSAESKTRMTEGSISKKMILFAFVVFSLAYFYTGFMGKISFIPENVQGLILMVVAALPMAIFGILPQAVVADIAQSDAITSGSNREGMFYAARTFAFKLGQSLSMLIFTAVSTIGAGNGTGYRIAAFGAAVFCCVGGIILVFYNEKRINGIISGK